MVPCNKCGVPVWVYTCHTDRSYWAPTPARNLVLNCIVNSEQVLGQLWGTKIVSNISTLKMFTVTVWNMIFVISIWQCQYLAAHQLEISYAAKLNFQWCLSNLYPFLLVCFDDRIIFHLQTNQLHRTGQKNSLKTKFRRRLAGAGAVAGVWRVSRVQLTWLSLLFLSDWTWLDWTPWKYPQTCCDQPPEPAWTDITAWREAALRAPPTPLESRRRQCFLPRALRTLPSPGNRGSASGSQRNSPQWRRWVERWEQYKT